MVNDLLDDGELRQLIEPFVTTHNAKEGIISSLQGGLLAKTLFVLDDDVQLKELRAFGIREKKDQMGANKVTFEALSGHDDTVIALALSYYSASKQTGIFHMEVL